MFKNYFDNDPVILSDMMGMGKTAQVCTLINLILALKDEMKGKCIVIVLLPMLIK